VTETGKPVVWLSGEVKTPPFSKAARIEAGLLLRQLQQGRTLGMPHARAMPGIGPRCLELRIPDEGQTWRIVLRTDPDAVVIAEVFSKKSRTTPKWVIRACRQRLRRYDEATKE
jgi:phage-related protein